MVKPFVQETKEGLYAGIRTKEGARGKQNPSSTLARMRLAFAERLHAVRIPPSGRTVPALPRPKTIGSAIPS